MTTFYVPYCGKKPAAVLVNGHRFLILSSEAESLEGHLTELGADKVVAVNAPDTTNGQEVVFSRLARTANSGVVIASPGLEVSEVLKNLSDQLPWLQ